MHETGKAGKVDVKSKEMIIEAYLKEGAELRLATIAIAQRIASAAEIITKAFRNSGKLMTFGNGGSAADAQHIAAEFSGRFGSDRAPLPALALTVNPSAVTAIANDYSFDEIFARQVQGLAGPTDVVIGISTSGRSKNVLRGLEAAKWMQAKTIGLCGQKGDMHLHSDIVLAVPGWKTSQLQEVHIAIGHLLCQLVEADLFG